MKQAEEYATVDAYALRILIKKMYHTIDIKFLPIVFDSVNWYAVSMELIDFFKVTLRISQQTFVT